MRCLRLLILGYMCVVLPRQAMAQPVGFLETFNGKTKGMLMDEGWDFFPNSGFSISVQQPYDQQYIRANAGEGNEEYLATPCVDFDSDLDTISFYYRSYGSTQGFFTLGWQSAFDDLGVNTVWLDTTPVTTVWTYLSATYDPPDTPDVCRIVFGFATLTSGSGGKLGIDHFKSEQAMLVYNCCDSFITCDSLLLPVNLLEFTSQELHGTVELQWASALEMGVSEYIIERSYDAWTFVPVGSVAAVGPGTEVVYYDYIDFVPPGLTAYYRLRIVDQHGGDNYSEIVSVRTAMANAMTVFPNPVFGSVFTIVPGVASEEYQLRVYDMIGELVHSEVIRPNESQVLLTIELPNSLPHDMFLVELCSEGNCEYQKISVGQPK